VGGDHRRGARLRVGGVVAGAVLVAVLGGLALVHKGGGGSEKPVSDAEARAHLDRIVAAAQARDWEQFCRLSAAVFNCELELNTAGRDAVPPVRPTIVESRFHEKQFSDGSTGRVLVVEGTDGRGRPYRTEVMVSRYEGHLEATNAVYWGSAEIYERERTDRRNRESDPNVRSSSPGR
jgi:hypothetical protein